MSRRAYEAMELERNRLIASVDQLQRYWREDRERLAELVGDVVDMKREGFTAAPSYPEPAPQQALPGEIEDALDRIGLTGGARGQMIAWATRQLARSVPAKDVAKDLLAGGLATVGAE